MISKFARTNLKLTFNSKTKILKNIQGVNFCGYKINEYRLKIRNQSKYRMKRKLKLFTKQLKSCKITLPEIQRSIAGKQDLFWAFFHNCLMIPVAMGLLKPIGILINPMLASIAMLFSSITVILNALRLKK